MTGEAAGGDRPGSYGGNSNSGGLEPLSPQQAVDMYLEARADELAKDTLSAQTYRLDAFCQFCDEKGIENLNNLDGRDCYQYRIWRREGHGEDRDEVKPATLRGQLSTLRAFLRFAADINAVEDGLHDRVPLPTVTGSDNVSETTLSPDRALSILEYLGQYEYASRNHIIVLLAWHTGCRLGGLRALDLRDLDLNGEHPAVRGPAVRFKHRPPATPLKNGEDGTRWNRIGNSVANALEAYIDGPREDVRDDDGRQPLLTTSHGRVSKTTVRNTLYRVTRPCWRGEPCPHDRDPADCEATRLDKASQCPSARSPHDVRSGRVTYYRRNDVPRRIVRDRLNASEDILDEHYDRRSAREKAQQRSDFLPDL